MRKKPRSDPGLFILENAMYMETDRSLADAHSFAYFLRKLQEECREVIEAADAAIQTGKTEELLHLVEEITDVRIVAEHIEQRLCDPKARGLNEPESVDAGTHIIFDEETRKSFWTRIFWAMPEYKKSRQVIREFSGLPKWGATQKNPNEGNDNDRYQR